MPRVQCPSKFTKVKSIISSFDIYIAYFELYAYMNSTLGKKQHASILLSVSENDLLSTSTAHLVDYLENDLDDQRTYITMLVADYASCFSPTEAMNCSSLLRVSFW